MLSAVVRIALALEILLVCTEGVLPPAHHYLPFGGSHFAQLGLVLGLAITFVDLWESLSINKRREVATRPFNGKGRAQKS